MGPISNLNRHRLMCMVNGLEYFDANGKIRGCVNEDWWTYSDMTTEDKAELLDLVCQSVEKMQRESVPLTAARVFGLVCAEYCVFCEHPLAVRDYSECDEMGPCTTPGVNIKRYYICGACQERITE